LDSLEISAGSLRTRYHFYTNKNIAGPLPCPFDKAKKSKSTELQRLTANTNGATTPKPLSPHGQRLLQSSTLTATLHTAGGIVIAWLMACES
jgi:hypothetical protein